MTDERIKEILASIPVSQYGWLTPDAVNKALQQLRDEIQKENLTGDLPLQVDHICFKDGHAMKNVYTFHNHQSSYGTNKCYRCGWEEPFQYDYLGSNPMYQQNNL